MKRMITSLLLCFFVWTSMQAQKSNEAAIQVLDKVTQTWKESVGTQIDFTGTIRGTLRMKDRMFHLATSKLECWYDGKTLWNYVPKDKEVMISYPTSHDMILVNPYFLLHNYKQTFDCQYGGQKKRNNQLVHIVTLTPKTKQDLRSVTIYIDGKNQPTYLKLVMTNGQAMEVRIKSVRRNQSYTVSDFTFDASKNTKVEIIDIR